MPHGEGGFTGGGTVFGSGGFGGNGDRGVTGSFFDLGRLFNLVPDASFRELQVLGQAEVLNALEGALGGPTGEDPERDPFGGGQAIRTNILPPSGGSGGSGPQQQRQPSNTELSVLLAIEIIRALIQGRARTPRITINRSTNVFGLPSGSPLPTTGTLGGGSPGGGGLRPIFSGGGGNVPMVPTFVAGLEGGSFGDLLSSGIGLLGQFLGGGDRGGGGALPGGAPLPFFGGGQGFLGLPSGAQTGAALGGACIVPSVGTTLRLPSRVDVPSPDGRTFVTFRNMGRPVLWSGDFAAAKRVKRVASRAKRRGGR